MRASVIAEKAGFRSVSIIQTGFVQLAKIVAEAMGMPDLAIVEYPAVVLTQAADDLEPMARGLIGEVIDGFTQANSPAVSADQTTEAVEVATEPTGRQVVAAGSLDDIQRVFHERGWSDGLPIIPPTATRVDEFLDQIQRPEDETIGEFTSDDQQATVLSVAVNGVMAGCRPEYMPLLVAIVEAIMDPKFFLEHAGSTSGWEPVVVLSGPIVEELDFHTGQGVSRIGQQANSSVGRFLRMYMRNIAGMRPLQHDKGTFGTNFNVVVAENGAAVAEIGWEPFGVDRGFTADDSVVTVQSAIGVSSGYASRGAHALDHAKMLADAIAGPVWSQWSWCGWFWGELSPLLVMSPSVARVFADDSWSKHDLRAYFAENVLIKAGDAEEHAASNSMTGYTLAGLVEEGLLPKSYALSNDPEREVPAFPWADSIGIVVAGDPMRNRSVGYAQHGRQGSPVSKKVG